MNASPLLLSPESPVTGAPSAPAQPRPAMGGLPPEPPPPKIQAFSQGLGARKHEENWKRTPNVTGTGAIHVKSFHGKLGDDSLGYLDQQINEWLDAHPQYEVKFVTTSVGEWQGKLKEPQMIVQLWL